MYCSKILSFALILGGCTQPQSPSPVAVTAAARGAIDIRQSSKALDCHKASNCLVALTFDDGPGPYTKKLLEIMEERHVKATFFVVGNRINAQTTPLLQRMVADGDQIGDHSWSHPELTKLSTGEVASQIIRTNNAIDSVVPNYHITAFRPPYGAMSTRVRKAVGCSPTMWDVDTLDWKYRDTARIIRVASTAQPGDVVLMHDIHPKTVGAVPQIINNLRRRGFQFVTINELRGNTCVQMPGEPKS